MDFLNSVHELSMNFVFGIFSEAHREMCVGWWRSSASDLQPIRSRFESRLLHFMNELEQVVHTHVPLFTMQYQPVGGDAVQLGR